MAAARCVEPPRYLHLHQLGPQPSGKLRQLAHRPEKCANWRGFAVRRPLPGVSRRGRLAAGSAVPAAGGRPALRFASFAAASARWLSSMRASLEIQAGHGQRRVPGGDGPHGLPRDRHTRPFARKRAVPDPSSSTDRRRWRPALGSRDRAMSTAGGDRWTTGHRRGEALPLEYRGSGPAGHRQGRRTPTRRTPACCPTTIPSVVARRNLGVEHQLDRLARRHTPLVEAAPARPSTASRAPGVQGAERPDPPLIRPWS